MTRLLLTITAFCLLSGSTFGQSNQFLTPFEKDSAQTTTHKECIEFYKKLSEEYSERLELQKIGETDGGHPIHIVLIHANQFSKHTGAHNLVLFINNGIHPGEPDGIDASMMFARNIVQRDNADELLNGVTVAIIPFYNVGGGLHRGCCSRANQNGPLEAGFRGNERNLDLNRDFVKCDSKNAKAFNEIFNKLKPHVFVDTHVSNGADYQYTLTLLATHPEKLPNSLAEFQKKVMLPKIYDKIQKRGLLLTPYVNVHGGPPALEGNHGFFDTPRYSTGYAALHNCMGFMTETHMLKPFPQRVKATQVFLEEILEICVTDALRIRNAKKRADSEVANEKHYLCNYEVDTLKKDSIVFHGYEHGYKLSNVSGIPRLYYDRSKPFSKPIPYYNSFIANTKVNKPKAYIVPRAWSEATDLLKLNGVVLTELKKDTIIEVEAYRILEFPTGSRPYEGHYMHHSVKVEKLKKNVQFYKGDYLVNTGQVTDKYTMNVLEPQSEDSYFNWNFFDSALQQKEYYSDYVFEDLADEFLRKNPKIKSALDEAKRNDSKLANDGKAQLDWVYKRSPWFESDSYMIYPVYRWL